MKIRLAILITFNSLIAFSQFNENIYMFEKNGTQGYIDNNFNVIIKPEYDKLGGFQEKFFGEYSIFKTNGKYGVLDTGGKHILPANYDYLENSYSPTLFIFRKDDKSGVVTIKGKVIIKPIYDYIVEFTNGGKSIIVQKDNKYALLSINGKKITDFKYEYIHSRLDSDICVAVSDGKCGFIDHKGKEFIEPLYKIALDFIDGHAIVKIDNNYGIIDKKGTFVIEPIYQNISYRYSFYHDHQFNNKSKIYYTKKDNKIGLLDENLNVIVSPIYDQIGDFNEGLAFVLKDGKYGFIDKEGVLTIPLLYEDADTFSEGLAPVVKNGKWGYIDSQNKVVIDFQFVGCVKPFFDGAAVYRKRNFKSSKAHYVDDKCGYIDLKGNVIIEPKYRNAKRFRNGVAKVDDKNSEYLINKNDKKIVLKSSEIEIMEIEGN